MYLIPPLSVYVLILLLLLLFVVHQFAGLCSQQKQMDNICPGRPGMAPGPRMSVCPQPSSAPSGGSSSTVLTRSLSSATAEPSGGRAVPPPTRGAEGQPREGRRGCEPGLLGKPGRRPVTRWSSCQTQPRPHPPVLLSFAERGNTTTGNKTAHARLKKKNRCIFTFL